jgi:DNA invertase Pin-like site-specific DNA recombinase
VSSSHGRSIICARGTRWSCGVLIASGARCAIWLDTVTALEGGGVGFRSVTELIDTTPPGGKLVFHIFAALAEFERNLIQERTRAGLQAARARGRNGGRPR